MIGLSCHAPAHRSAVRRMSRARFSGLFGVQEIAIQHRRWPNEQEMIPQAWARGQDFWDGPAVLFRLLKSFTNISVRMVARYNGLIGAVPILVSCPGGAPARRSPAVYRPCQQQHLPVFPEWLSWSLLCLA